MVIKVHPLFICFGILLIFLKNGEYFLFCVLFSFLHELGHVTMAKHLGVKIKNITLMPYGALVNCNIDYLDNKDNIKLAISGPFINITFCILLAALWWIYPVSFSYTSYMLNINMGIFLINLLPCYPLDGGRVVLSLINKNIEKTEKIIRILGVVVSFILFILFLISIFFRMNISILFIAIFIFIGAVKGIREEKIKVYAKLFLNDMDRERYMVKEIMVKETEKIFTLYKLLKDKYYIRFLVVDKDMNIIFKFDEKILRDNFSDINLSQSVKNLVKYIY